MSGLGEYRCTRHGGEKPKMDIRLLTAIKVTWVQSTHWDYAYSVPYGPYGCWSAFIGTFRSLDFERSASQNRITSTPVTTIVEKERFFWSYYDRKAKNYFKLSVSPPTHPQSLPVVPNYIFVITCALQKHGSMRDKRTFQTI